MPLDNDDNEIREFSFPDGKRRIAFKRKHIAFICELEEAGQIKIGHVLIAARTNAKPCPVLGDYKELLAWWKGGKSPSPLARHANGRGTSVRVPGNAKAKPTALKSPHANSAATGEIQRRILTLPKPAAAKDTSVNSFIKR